MRRVGPQTNTAGGGGGAFFTATSKIEQNGTSFENNLAGYGSSISSQPSYLKIVRRTVLSQLLTDSQKIDTYSDLVPLM